MPTDPVSATLVGRKQELEQLMAFAGEATRRGQCLLVQGPAGIGKSFILEVFAQRIRDLGFHHLVLSGVQSEARLAFSGLHQLLRPVLHRAGELPPRQREALLAAFGMSERVVPDPYLIALGVLELLALTANDRPVLAVVDDAQWLDQPTAEALAFVVRRIGDDRVAFVIATRDGYDSPLRAPALPVLELGPLDDEEAVSLLDAHAPDLGAQVRRRVLSQSRGYPLALVELATAPIPPSPVQTSGVADLPMSARLERAFSSRYADLEGATRMVLLLAAANDANEVGELVNAGEALGLGDALRDPDIWSSAIVADLVSVREQRVEFRHPLVRSAIYQAATPTQRASVHAALAQTLEDQPDRQVWHRVAATSTPDEQVAAEVEAAADRAEARGGRMVTLEALERSALLTPDGGRRAERYLRAAELALELGDPLASTRLSEQVQELVLGPRSRGRLRLLEETLAASASTPDGVAAKVGELLTLARHMAAQDDRDLALSFAHLAALQTWVADVGEELRSDVLEAAEQLASSSADPLLLSVYSLTDPNGHNTELIDRALSIAPYEADAHTAHLISTALNFAGAFGLSAPFSASAASTLRAEGRLRQLVVVLAQQAWSAFPPLNWAVALPAAEEAFRLAQETEQPLWRASAHIVQGILAGVRGDFEHAESHIAAAEAIALPMGANAMLCGLQLTRGLTAIAAGRDEEAFQQLRRLFDTNDPAYHHFQSAWALGDLAEAALHTGNLEEARAQLELYGPRARTGESTWTQVALLYARPLLAEDDDAESLFQSALRADLSAWPLYRARLLLNYGRWLRRQRRSADSRAPLRSAREAFDALGAAAFAEQARTELRAAGERSQGLEHRAWHDLSPQELHIARLAADGLTNREIGERLYLSHRTVASHLYRVYPKLGITSRAQLRTALAQLG